MKYFSLQLASQQTGLSRNTLKNQAVRGRLKAVKDRGRYLTTDAWLQEYLASRGTRPQGRQARPPTERFLEKIEMVDGCAQWTGAVQGRGYGTFRVARQTGGPMKTVLAHRFAYETFIGPVPDGLELDHICRNRRCVGVDQTGQPLVPAHIEAVTHSVNVMRGATPGKTRARQGAKTHCPRGHPYDERNTYVDRAGRRN